MIDCVYNESTEKVSIGKSVSYKGVAMTVKNVKQYAFYKNTFLQDLDLSFEGTLENNAFQGCTALNSAALGDQIASIGAYAFSGCNALPSLVIPNGVTTIGGYALQNCNSLKSLGIPQSVTSIGNYAFSGCTSVTNLNLADRKTDDTELVLGSNGSSALFADCPLEEVYIGRNISYSTASYNGYSPFYRNTSLKTVTITDKETEISTNEFYGCTNLKNVTIGDGVTTIGDYAFSGCSSLESFSFGMKVETIGKEAFSDCTAITKLVSRSTVPPTCGSQALDDVNKFECTLSIPKGSLAAYQEAEQWKEFFFTNESTGEEDEPIGDDQCATPTIAMEDGKVVFDCETPGVIYHYQMNVSGLEENVGNLVSVPSSCTVTVYATKDGYKNSAPASKIFNIRGLKGDVNGDGQVTITDAVGVVDIILNEGKE